MTRDPISLQVGKNIRLHRRQKGLTIVELAKKLGTSHQQVQRYESGLNGTSAGVLYYVAVALSVDVRVFYEGLEYNADVERNHEIHWSTLHSAELLDAIPETELKSTLQKLVQILAAETIKKSD